MRPVSWFLDGHLSLCPRMVPVGWELPGLSRARALISLMRALPCDLKDALLHTSMYWGQGFSMSYAETDILSISYDLSVFLPFRVLFFLFVNFFFLLCRSLDTIIALNL